MAVKKGKTNTKMVTGRAFDRLPTYGSQIAKQMEIDVYTIRNVV
jgi:hypothetical protein